MARKIDPEKRERILQAAREIFKERGVEKASMAAIAKKADMATGTIYLYFKSKEDIVEGLVDYYLTKSAERVLRTLSNPDLAEAVRDAVHEALQHASEERDLLRLIDVHRGSGRIKLTKGDEMGLAAAESLMERAIAKGRGFPYRHPRIVAEIVGGMIEWIAKLCFVYKAADIRRYEETLVTMLLHLTKEPPRS